MKRISTLLCALFALLISQTATSAGLLFNVSATGTPANLSITLCLNGNGPLSCQNYTVSALNLSISTTIPNHVYPAVGMKVNTPGYVLAGCTPTANGYCLFSANSTTPASITVSSTSAFSVGGTVSGLSGTVVLQNNGGDSQTISSNGPFAFSTPVTAGEPYAVTVQTQPADQTCTVSNGSGTMGSANVTNVTVTCSTNTYTVGGTITGLTGTVTLQNNGTNFTPISTDGNFTFSTPIAEGSSYSVTVQTQPADQTCSVANGSGTMGGANVTNVTVTCSTNTYTVGGTVSGLSGTVTLQNNGTNSTPISSNGSFTFSTPIAEGSTYSVTVSTQPATQTCTVSNGSGTMGGANVTNVTVTCSTNTYTVGGTVSGLSGTVTLQNNSANSTPISSNGSFTFSTPAAEGSAYNVTVQTQPTEQTCTVTNGSGTIGSSNVTNVSVSCATNNTTITVSTNGTIPVNGSSGSLTVTNTGTTYDAYNVLATLPGGWTGVTQNATGCTAIPPNGGTCTLTFTSTTPYVAQGSITVTGDNITSPPTTALAFSMDGYLVWSVSGTSPSATALVIGSGNASSSQVWSTDFFNIPGITETSSAPPCNGATDGACDTGQIEAHYLTPYINYAAGLCYEITSDTSGTVTIGTWYLPAICQMGGASQGAGCSSGLANIDTNLVQLGFSGLAGGYWSSTEYSGLPTSVAWYEDFASGSGSGQCFNPKSNPFSVRCARAFTY